ncbi:hypothetical protein JZ785_05440 [Alicyclobacillus curvatus]|nr:hypothetical protein JZ785_05440 [Alicyclobacillus curvatus]
MTHQRSSMKASPMRTPESRMHFCDEYFAAVGAPQVYTAEEYREYELPRDIDKELTHRPFYWMWVEQTGQNVPQTILRLAFSEVAEERENQRVRDAALAQASPYLTDIQRQYFVAPKVELVALGSFRLDKLYDSCLQRGRFASVAPRNHIAGGDLVPWLMLNCLISYRCDITEQSLVSIGVCLENGQYVEGFHHMIENIDMSVLDPRLIQTRMQVSVKDGLKKIRERLHQKITQANHHWAVEAHTRLTKEIEQIETYYDSLQYNQTDTEKVITRAERQRKVHQAIARGAPQIDVEMKQIALVGLVDKGNLGKPSSLEASQTPESVKR